MTARRPGSGRGPVAGRRPVAAAGAVAATALVLVGCSSSSPSASPGPSPSASSGSAAPTTGNAGPIGVAPTPSASSSGHGKKHRGKPVEVAPAAPSLSSVGTGLPGSDPVRCPGGGTGVHDAAGLTRALAAAGPGTTITLADGTYRGKFVAAAAASGTPAQPVFLCGGRGAVLDAGSTTGGYAFHLDHASYWRLVGFTVQDAQKGVVLDGSHASVVQGLLVQDIGDEGIHLRDATTDTVVVGNTVRDTGKRRTKFGEGVYVGSAVSNWCTNSSCQPDRSDHDVVRGNTFSRTTAENVDIKEGTTGGALLDNTFDGGGLSGTDSWVDVKGNGWLVKGNTGSSSPVDGFQTHQVVAGWGVGNLFRDNRSEGIGSGLAIHLTPAAGNVVGCSNTVTGGHGLTNVACARAY